MSSVLALQKQDVNHYLSDRTHISPFFPPLFYKGHHIKQRKTKSVPFTGRVEAAVTTRWAKQRQLLHHKELREGCQILSNEQEQEPGEARRQNEALTAAFSLHLNKSLQTKLGTAFALQCGLQRNPNQELVLIIITS